MNTNKRLTIPAGDVRVFPFAGDGKWYSQDNDCDEPMGPFDSYREAYRDYKAMRKSAPTP